MATFLENTWFFLASVRAFCTLDPDLRAARKAALEIIDPAWRRWMTGFIDLVVSDPAKAAEAAEGIGDASRYAMLIQFLLSAGVPLAPQQDDRRVTGHETAIMEGRIADISGFGRRFEAAADFKAAVAVAQALPAYDRAWAYLLKFEGCVPEAREAAAQVPTESLRCLAFLGVYLRNKVEEGAKVLATEP